MRLCKRPATVWHPVTLFKVNRIKCGVADACFRWCVANPPAVTRAAKAPDTGLDCTRVGNIPGRHPVIKIQLLKVIEVPRIRAVAKCRAGFIPPPG